jgi:hypothetical protein
VKRSTICTLALTGIVVAAALAACTSPRTAQEIIARSVEAHGGDRLTNWRTLTIHGRAEMFDLIPYKAAYTLQAKAPGRLRVEHDMTVGRGRSFREYFLNDGMAWSRQNLLVGKADLRQLRRWLGQCNGIAHYARNAHALTLKGESSVEWKEKKDGTTGYQPVETRRAYMISAVVDDETTDLWIDEQTFYLIQETAAGTRRVYHNFKPFSGAVWPTEVLEFVATRQSETITPFKYDSVIYNEPVEDWVFSEDMPERAPMNSLQRH